ncbi:putative SKP1-like protein 9 [Cocos nucifera]|uniref:Putative SKP1-like protein 9 n=1 Tax=Cocos nucifera TaxID=13894 RepID=A0A8K0IMU6_COCNU|nr:putative SKP1-like protein 9 [Cocos nucifera]
MFLKCLSFGVVSVNGQYLLNNQKSLCWGTLLFIFRGYYQMSESDMAIIKPEAMKSYIWLQCADGSIQQVEEEVAMFCPMICQEILQTAMGSSKNYAISLPQRVNPAILSLILDYCRFHQVPGRSNKERKSFDEKFIRIDTKRLCELTSAADSLQLKPLVDLTSRALARMIEGKTPEEIRETFHLPDDLTEEEKLEPLKNANDDLRIRLLNRLYAKKRKELKERQKQKDVEVEALQKDERSVDEILSFINGDGETTGLERQSCNFPLYFCSVLPYMIRGYYQMSESDMAIIKPEAMKSYIWLQCADGSIQQLEEEVAMFCPMICQEILQTAMGSSKNYAISLPQRVNPAILSLILDYCRFHQVPGRSNKERKSFDEKFIRIDTKRLCELTSAADSLQLKPLVDLTSRALARMIEGKTPEEIRETFHLPDDLTEEEKLEPLKNANDDLRIRLLNRLYAKKRKELKERQKQKDVEVEALQKDERSVDEILSFINGDGAARAICSHSN